MKRSEVIHYLSINLDLYKDVLYKKDPKEAARFILSLIEGVGMMPPLTARTEQVNPILDGEYGGIVLEARWENENEEVP